MSWYEQISKYALFQMRQNVSFQSEHKESTINNAMRGYQDRYSTIDEWLYADMRSEVDVK